MARIARRSLLLLLTCSCLPSDLLWAQSSATPKRIPQPNELAEPVQEYFAKQPGYKEGDLVTREAVNQMLTQLERSGWQIVGRAELLEKVLPENDFLVQQLRTPKGRSFHKKINSVPGGIDRVDRLLRMPHGEDNVRQLIQKVPDGHKWIEAMVETPYGQRMSQQMAKSATGQNFTTPTKRIYTFKDLQRAVIASARWAGTTTETTTQPVSR